MPHPSTQPPRRSRWSLAVKLGAAFALALLLGSAFLGAHAYRRARGAAVRAEQATLELFAERLAGEVESYLLATRSLAGNLALSRDVRGFLEGRPRPTAGGAFNLWLDREVAITPGASAIFVMAPDGTCLASSNRAFIARNFKFRLYFQEALAGRPNTSDWFIGSVTRTPRVSSAAPVLGPDGTVQGVLVVEYYVEAIEQAVRGFGGTSRSTALLDRHGISLVHSQASLVYRTLEPLAPEVLAELARTRQFLEREIPVAPLSPEFARAFREVQASGQSRIVQYRLEGVVKWAVLHPVKGKAWVVSVAVPESVILGPSLAIGRETLLVGLASTAGAFLVAVGLLRWLLRPLGAFASAIEAFGRGDVHARAPRQGQRELEQLAHTYNAMADRIQEDQERLEERVDARTRELAQALAEVRRLGGLLPICSYCKKIRDDNGYWNQVEAYLREHSDAEFTHGICPECTEKVLGAVRDRGPGA